jgi:sirohydrochlorin ferrochelatase
MAETPAGQVEDEPVATYWMVVLAVVVLFAGLLTVTVAKAGAAVVTQKRQRATTRRRIPEKVFIKLFCFSVRFKSFGKRGRR